MTKEELNEIKKLNENIDKVLDLRIIKIYSSRRRFFFFNLFRGLAVGLGSVLGATVLVAALIFLLSNLQWIPLVGDFISQLLDYIRSSNLEKISQF